MHGSAMRLVTHHPKVRRSNAHVLRLCAAWGHEWGHDPDALSSFDQDAKEQIVSLAYHMHRI